MANIITFQRLVAQGSWTLFVFLSVFSCFATLTDAYYSYDETGDAQSYDACWENATNIYDSNWTTYSHYNDSCGNEKNSEYYVNYTKVTAALTTSKWKVKDGDGTEYGLQYLTIPSSGDENCWVQDPLQFKVQSWFDGGWIPDAQKGTNWSCWNSTRWVSLGGYVPASDGGDYKVYEEGMYWNITDPIQSINSVRNDSIPTTHTFNVTLSDNGNCTLYLNGTRYATSTASSYQEDPNSTNPDSCSGLYDGDWDTTCEVIEFEGLSSYFNYTKPSGANRAVWETKDGAGTLNTTIPKACFDQSVLQLYVYINPFVGPPGSHLYVEWSCYSGSDWVEVSKGLDTNDAYEEAIWWYGTNDNLTWTKTLNPGNYSTIYYTCNTSWAKQNSTTFWLYVDVIPPVFTNKQPANDSQYSGTYAYTDVEVTFTTDEEVSKCGYSLSSQQLSAMTTMGTLNAGPPYYQHKFNATLPAINIQRCWYIRCNDTQGNNQTYATTYCLYINGSLGGGPGVGGGGGSQPDVEILEYGAVSFAPRTIFAWEIMWPGKTRLDRITTSFPVYMCGFEKAQCGIESANAVTLRYPLSNISNSPFFSDTEKGFICPTKDECYNYQYTVQGINLGWHIPLRTGFNIGIVTPEGINAWFITLIVAGYLYLKRDIIKKRIKQR